MNHEFKKLLVALEAYRLRQDLVYIEEGIKENVQVEKKEDDGFFKKIGKSMSNSVKKSRTENLEKSKKADEDRLQDIASVYGNLVSDHVELKNAIDAIIKNDNDRLLFACAYLLSDKNEYEEKDKTRGDVSFLLFGDAKKLSEVSKAAFSHAAQVTPGVFGSMKGSEAVIYALQGYLSSSRNGDCAYCLAHNDFDGVAIDEAVAKAAIALEAILLMGNKNMPYCKDDGVLAEEAFFALSRNDLCAALALRSYLLTLQKEESDFLDQVKSILRSLSLLRYEAEVLRIVEKKDIDSTKDKIAIIDLAIEHIANLLK